LELFDGRERGGQVAQPGPDGARIVAVEDVEGVEAGKEPSFSALLASRSIASWRRRQRARSSCAANVAARAASSSA
jgi:hypothetical protein